MVQRAATKMASAPRPTGWDNEGEVKAGDDGTVMKNRGAHHSGPTGENWGRRGGRQEVHEPFL
jgi:hypothetical protein